MRFDPRPSGRLAPLSTGDHPSGQAGRLSLKQRLVFLIQASAGMLVAAALMGSLTVARAQAVPASAQAASAPRTADNEDPVSRFLSEKGLLPSARPVVDFAQQMRDKASDMASELVLSAMDFLGVPYRRGGESREQGFDCSGFTRHVFEKSVGLILPRRAIEQANSPDLVPVQQSELKPGDLVFFNTLRHTFSHVGIYIGDNKFIHSPRAGGAVRVEDMRVAYWQQRYDGARRAPTMTARVMSGGDPTK
ncbi:C40 family peptidase [uncultured Aquabacterium sp.]|uniref:C40 family peptidase n=1 Tax=Aquabacterium sp. TaxID=1872578 RepID=UPI00345AF012